VLANRLDRVGRPMLRRDPADAAIRNLEYPIPTTSGRQRSG
jgi:hypothetical protein